MMAISLEKIRSGINARQALLIALCLVVLLACFMSWNSTIAAIHRVSE